MKNIPGTPAYWQNTLYDALGMVRQLGPFTFFVTFSSADLRWPEVIKTVARQYGHELSIDQVKAMSWEDRCSWIRRNPVIVARQFDFRCKTLFDKLLKPPASLLGPMTDYLIKTEFQQRGSPHIHCLIWVEGAPRLEDSSRESVIDFIDKYISVTMSNEQDPGLTDLVQNLQVHKCSKRCEKKKKCRFNFPQLPSSETLLVGSIDKCSDINTLPADLQYNMDYHPCASKIAANLKNNQKDQKTKKHHHMQLCKNSSWIMGFCQANIVGF